MTRAKLLIVEDDEEIRTQMKWALANDYDIVLAGERAGALEAFAADHPLVVLLDLGLPPRPADPDEGLATLAELTASDSLTKIIVITGQGEKGIGLRAIGGGAYDFMAKPVEMEELKILLKRVFHVAQLEMEIRRMQQEARPDLFEGMLGTSDAMRSLFDTIRKVATTDAPVLLLGESGTGKEMAAQAIHQCSARRKGPFIVINCSAIPETLLESELFGHEKGSFTGAHTQRKGRFESAIGGTLFLDEIGEIPLPLQVKLLRFLQEQCIERVGGRQPIPIDARIITATNADLKKGLVNGTFREDLFYRLAVVKIALPPLREREDDIRLLAHYFLQRFAEQAGKPGLAFDQESMRALSRNPWPGNVRQLENCIRRAVIMTERKRLTVRDLELPAAGPGAGGATLKEARERFEKEMIQNALRRHGGKIAPAAVELGVGRPTLYDLMDKLGIPRE
ncbi:MAG TPA: PEP-CTERM-box response regulator transcription factor [Candidatus Acidoferrum sp.]|nr:PEP-CTERM-box response regulator transcription factor [Candidatus Acidoferrum sp.]